MVLLHNKSKKLFEIPKILTNSRHIFILLLKNVQYYKLIFLITVNSRTKSWGHKNGTLFGTTFSH